MDDAPDFKSLQAEVQAALVSTVKSAGQIASEDLGFHRSLNPEVGAALEEQSARLLALSINLLKSAAAVSDLQAPTFEDAEDVDNNWRNVVDVVDSLLEKTDTCLDEYTGVIKRKAVDESAAAPKPQKKGLDHSLRTQNLVKPQLAFEVKPDNTDTSPWQPLLTSKPHATVPLKESLGTFTNEYDQNQYKHPYETEILQLKYPDAVYQKADPILYLPVETTSATFVDTYEGVLEMLEELKGAKEIAVDLEHHDARSYVGLVSLMQVSIREKDWIVDTLKPWRQKLQVLNEVFADPSIVKVFHGAYMDIVWLQRDLGLYVVGLFDTHYACKALGFPAGSLAFLLKKYIDFDADKKYQLADWRIRPLPEEMFFYARADTHFLLYIYDMLRNELVEKSNTEIPEENLIEQVLQKSKETSLLRFERQVYNAESGKGPGGWFSLIYKTPSLLNSEQFSVFKAVHQWRDQIARKDDDSINFVMPNSVILSLAKLMPMDMMALLNIVRPISHSVKSRIEDLLQLIKTAKAKGKDGPKSIDILKPDTAGAITRASKASSPSKIDVTPVDSTELTTETSSFWGGAFGSSIWDQTPAAPETDGMRLAIPLPQLSEEVFASSSALLTDRSRQAITPSKPTPTATPVTPIDEPFVLKRGAKRKSEVISEPEPEEPTGEYDISLNDSTEENEKATAKAAKKARRAGRKARKLQKKEQAEEVEEGDEEEGDEGEEEEEEEEEEEDFDYSKAESVLHAKREKVNNKGGKSKKPFDPYAKSMDTGKGMRRVQTERAGRSATFRK